jgi:membrane associated rhomboid family serine protease
MDAIPGYKTVCALALAMLALQAANTFTGYALNSFALVPRTLGGLPGLLLSPWLHGSWFHLIGNLLPFAMLSAIVLRDGTSRYLTVSAVVIVLGGLLVWCFGRRSIHVGASGWVFGLWAYILASAWYRRSLDNLIAALFVAVFHGGMVLGFLPRHGVSFEFHLAGSLAGIAAARLLVAQRQSA